MSKATLMKYGTIAAVTILTTAVVNRLAKRNATVAKAING